MPGKEGFVLTGQLGDVMKESARIALSYVRGHADGLGISPDAFRDREFHVHVPAGAIPKDGPSAGITMTTALASLLSGRPVKHNVGMTGEVTLQGRVLPIGGLKQKVLAAHAAGLTDVILPERNRGDLDDVPEDVREQMRVPPGDDDRRGAEPGARARAGRLASGRVARLFLLSDRFPRVPLEVREDRGRDLLFRVGGEQVSALGHQLQLRAGDQRRKFAPAVVGHEVVLEPVHDERRDPSARVAGPGVVPGDRAHLRVQRERRRVVLHPQLEVLAYARGPLLQRVVAHRARAQRAGRCAVSRGSGAAPRSSTGARAARRCGLPGSCTQG